MTETMKQYLALSDYGKAFCGDLLAVHVDEATLLEAVEYGQLAEGLRAGVSGGKISTGMQQSDASATPAGRLSGGEYFRFLHPGAQEEPEAYD
jgi:hypothetical protein